MMLNFQFGQFHAMAIALAVGAMIAFEERRHAVGGALLAFAILSKVFPGVLLVALLALRRWREIGWTLAFAGLFVLMGLLVLGTDPFVSFVSYQLPRLVNGEAFSFIDRSDVPVLVVARNLSIYGVAAKLKMLGVSGDVAPFAGALTWAYTAAVLWLAWRAGRGGPTRLTRVLIWLSLLNLAAMRSPVAPSVYVAAPMLWVLALLACGVRGRYGFGVGLAALWLVIMGPPPLPDRIDLLAGLLAQALAVALGVWVLVYRVDSSTVEIAERRAV
jgi:hypothetical protein